MSRLASSVVTTAPASKGPEGGKREAILAAALHLFSERGFHGTAMPLVAEAAGVGAGTVYRYFEGKEALVNALYRECKQRFASTLLGGLDASLPTRRVFHDLWSRLGQFAAAEPEALAFLELHHHGAYLDEQSLAMDRMMTAAVVEVVAHAQRQGTLKAVPAEMLCALVFGALSGMVKAEKAGQLAVTPALLDQAEACLWEAIRA